MYMKGQPGYIYSQLTMDVSVYFCSVSVLHELSIACSDWQLLSKASDRSCLPALDGGGWGFQPGTFHLQSRCCNHRVTLLLLFNDNNNWYSAFDGELTMEFKADYLIEQRGFATDVEQGSSEAAVEANFDGSHWLVQPQRCHFVGKCLNMWRLRSSRDSWMRLMI